LVVGGGVVVVDGGDHVAVDLSNLLGSHPKKSVVAWAIASIVETCLWWWWLRKLKMMMMMMMMMMITLVAAGFVADDFLQYCMMMVVVFPPSRRVLTHYC
jgi:hypothetical protein